MFATAAFFAARLLTARPLAVHSAAVSNGPAGLDS
jgi:hypothetical protein